MLREREDADRLRAAERVVARRGLARRAVVRRAVVLLPRVAVDFRAVGLFELRLEELAPETRFSSCLPTL